MTEQTQTNETTYTEDQIIEGLTGSLKKTVQGYFESGMWLTRAKAYTDSRGIPWEPWLWQHAGIGKSYASKLMAIWGNEGLRAVSHEKLPKSTESLYELSALSPEDIAELSDMDLSTWSREDARNQAVRKGKKQPRKHRNPDKPSSSELEAALDERDQELADALNTIADLREQTQAVRNDAVTADEPATIIAKAMAMPVEYRDELYTALFDAMVARFSRAEKQELLRNIRDHLGLSPAPRKAAS